MGLLFALDPDKKHSSADDLLLRSSAKRKGLAMGMLFGGVFLGTMFYAAKPLFDKFLEEGTLFDKFLSAFFYVTVFAYPLLAILIIMYEQQVVIRREQGGFLAETFKKLAFVKWARKESRFQSLGDLKANNWKGALNTAALKAQKHGVKDRYATRGHWMLEIEGEAPEDSNILERRARKEDIDWLKLQIEEHFKDYENEKSSDPK